MDSPLAGAVQGAAQDRQLRLATPFGCQARTAATARLTHRQRPTGNTPTTEQCSTIISRGSHLCPCDIPPISRVTRAAYAHKATTLINDNTMSMVGWLTNDEFWTRESGLERYSFRLSFGGCQIRLSVVIQTAMTENSVGLVTLRSHMPAQYFVIHNCFLPHSLQFITRCYSLIRLCTVWTTANTA